MKKHTLILTVLVCALSFLPALARGPQKGPGGGGTAPVLTTAEKESLIFMREEEKLARDVYLGLYERWGLPVFDHIAQSEQRHMDAVKTLIDKYGLTDPVVNDSIGVFANSELQELYDYLVDLGSESLLDGLYVGQLIEITDIADLESALANPDITKPDIVRVYGNLLAGSYNHLAAFNSLIDALQE